MSWNVDSDMPWYKIHQFFLNLGYSEKNPYYTENVERFSEDYFKVKENYVYPIKVQRDPSWQVHYIEKPTIGFYDYEWCGLDFGYYQHKLNDIKNPFWYAIGEVRHKEELRGSGFLCEIDDQTVFVTTKSVVENFQDLKVRFGENKVGDLREIWKPTEKREDMDIAFYTVENVDLCPIQPLKLSEKNLNKKEEIMVIGFLENIECENYDFQKEFDAEYHDKLQQDHNLIFSHDKLDYQYEDYDHPIFICHSASTLPGSRGSLVTDITGQNVLGNENSKSNYTLN